MSKKLPRDRLRQIINVGDLVVVSLHNQVRLAYVTKTMPKSIMYAHPNYIGTECSRVISWANGFSHSRKVIKLNESF